MEKSGIPLSVYVASSWRNKLQQDVVSALRGDGHSVYDFRNPAPGNTGFSWRQIGDRFGKCAACGEEDPLKKPKLCPMSAGTGLPSAHDWVGGWDAAYFATTVLDHPVSKHGFDFDMNALEAASACVFVLPCGRSASMELGFAVGRDKLSVVYIPTLDEPELMYRMCDYVVSTEADLRRALSQSRPPPRWQRDVEKYDAEFRPNGKEEVWHKSAPESLVRDDTFARVGEVVGPCRPYLHRQCKACGFCWRHGACTCGPVDPELARGGNEKEPRGL